MQVHTVQPAAVDLIGCRDQCGRTVPADQVESSGWEMLPIQKRYRCTECWRALRQVNTPRPQPLEGTL